MKAKVKVVTPIVAPVVDKDILKLYISKGWIRSSPEAEHLDRAFIRNHEGKPMILGSTFRGCLNRYWKTHGGKPRWAKSLRLHYAIADDLPYIFTNLRSDAAIVYEAFIPGQELILYFDLPEDYVDDLIADLNEAGSEFGIGAMLNRGYGKFLVERI